MKISKLSSYWEQIEAVSSRLSMTDILAELLKEADIEEVDKVCYLSLGRLGPLFANTEFNLAEKMMVKAVAQAYDISQEIANEKFKSAGDIGTVVALLGDKIIDKDLSVGQVHSQLLSIATDSGTGSQERKLQGVAKLLQTVDANTAKYLVRIPISKMRLGFSDKTVLDALSVMTTGDKSAKAELESAYNVRPDVGRLAKLVKKEGIEAVKKLQEPELGVPILMAKAQRASSGEEILLRIGDCGVEPKIDGFRLQIHKQGNDVKLFTRGLEDVTFMYPDIVEASQKQIKADNAIVEGEAIAYDPETGKNLPFQETVQRKRKHGIDELAKSVPLKLIAFELLYLDGDSYLDQPFIKRRKELEDIITHGKRIVLSEKTHVQLGEAELLEKIFEKALADNFEGIMAKRLDAKYVAGARNFNWIKYKKSYSSSLSDTVDAVVLGYDLGKGKRTQFGIGGFLVGVYDEETKTYKTVSKVGTGLSDDQWRELKKESEELRVKSKPNEYEVYDVVDVDVWLDPKIVVELEADELTLSTMHSAGLALRFPRLKRFRDDKQPTQATNLTEINQLYNNQIK